MPVQIRQLIALTTLAYLQKFSIAFSASWGIPPAKRQLFGSGDLKGSLKEEDDNDSDWRAYRAKLVMNETTSSSNLFTASSTSTLSSWAYDAGLLVEKGSIVLSKIESSLGCHDLRQPYFCKCVVLIIDHDEEFTQGIILNRPSNLHLNDEDIVYMDDDDSLIFEDQQLVGESIDEDDDGISWRMFFGGDIGGLYDDPMIVCLHNLTSKLADSVSDSILPGVKLTSHLAARELVKAGETTSDSFFTFYGFCGWDPGQLEREVRRGSWYMVSCDPQTLWNELQSLRKPSYDPRSAGISTWHNIVNKIGKGNETSVEENGRSSLLSDNASFADSMLREWATEMLLVSNDDDNDNEYNSSTSSLQDSDIYRALKASSTTTFGQLQSSIPKVGDLLQPGSGSSIEKFPFLLQNQFLHKSTILLLQDTNDVSIGLILNLPTSNSYSMVLSNGQTVDFPIRYGGPAGYAGSQSGDNDDEEGHLIWLHANKALKTLDVGSPVRAATDDDTKNSNYIWTCSLGQVKSSLESNKFDANDFLLVQGFCVWEKEEANDGGGRSGGILGQVMTGNFETISTSTDDDDNNDEDNLNMMIWSSLQKQSKLIDENTLMKNYDMAITAWNQGRNNDNEKTRKGESSGRLVYGTNVEVWKLADDALLAWMKIYLLGNAEFYV